MGLRPARTTRKINKPAWTRHSKRRPRKSYVKSLPHKNLNTYEQGVMKEDYDAKIVLLTKDAVQIRDNAMEAARQTLNRHLDRRISGSYKFIIKKYPHQILRENRMLSGAGADRISKGMRKSFGKPSDLAARFRQNDAVFEVYTYSNKFDVVSEAYRKAGQKLSGNFKVLLEPIGGNE
jgi:large subunit ribosomal protein L10e